MSLSISQGIDKVGITVESDPLAAKKANNLNDLVSASDARNNLGVPYATNAQSQAGLSSASVLTPSNYNWADKRPSKLYMTFVTMSGSTSGTGSGAIASAGGMSVTSPTTAIGYGVGSAFGAFLTRGVNRGNGSFNWSKPFHASFKFARGSAPADTNCVTRVVFGKSVTAAGDPTARSVGIRQIASNVIELIVHNGTTLTSVSTSFVPSVPIVTDMRIISDGTGNVSLYINDVLSASTSSGPNSSSAGSFSAAYITVEAENLAVISTTNTSVSVYNIQCEFSE